MTEFPTSKYPKNAASSKTEQDFSKSPSLSFIGFAVRLQNKSENNCFVNVIIHTIFHCKTFMKILLNDTVVCNKIMRNHEILRNFFMLMTEYNTLAAKTSQTQELNPYNFRVSLANYFKSMQQDIFQLKETGDPIELFQFVWNSLHSSQIQDSFSWACNEKPCSPPCKIHELFYLNIKEQYKCDTCPFRKEIKYDSNYFVYEVYIKELLRVIKSYKFSFKDFQHNFFDWLQTMYFQTDWKCEKCKRIWNKSISCSSIGEYFTINLTWNDIHPKKKNIWDAYCSIANKFNPRKQFVSDKNSNINSDYFWFGVIGFGSGHYISAFYSREIHMFILYDDNHLSVFNEWIGMVKHFLANHIHPVALLYQKGVIDNEYMQYNFSINEQDYKVMEFKAKEIDEWVKLQKMGKRMDVNNNIDDNMEIKKKEEERAITESLKKGNGNQEIKTVRDKEKLENNKNNNSEYEVKEGKKKIVNEKENGNDKIWNSNESNEKTKDQVTDADNWKKMANNQIKTDNNDSDKNNSNQFDAKTSKKESSKNNKHSIEVRKSKEEAKTNKPESSEPPKAKKDYIISTNIIPKTIEPTKSISQMPKEHNPFIPIKNHNLYSDNSTTHVWDMFGNEENNYKITLKEDEWKCDYCAGIMKKNQYKCNKCNIINSKMYEIIQRENKIKNDDLEVKKTKQREEEKKRMLLLELQREEKKQKEIEWEKEKEKGELRIKQKQNEMEMVWEANIKDVNKVLFREIPKAANIQNITAMKTNELSSRDNNKLNHQDTDPRQNHQQVKWKYHEGLEQNKSLKVLEKAKSENTNNKIQLKEPIKTEKSVHNEITSSNNENLCMPSWQKIQNKPMKNLINKTPSIKKQNNQLKTPRCLSCGGEQFYASKCTKCGNALTENSVWYKKSQNNIVRKEAQANGMQKQCIICNRMVKNVSSNGLCNDCEQTKDKAQSTKIKTLNTNLSNKKKRKYSHKEYTRKDTSTATSTGKSK